MSAGFWKWCLIVIQRELEIIELRRQAKYILSFSHLLAPAITDSLISSNKYLLVCMLHPLHPTNRTIMNAVSVICTVTERLINQHYDTTTAKV